MSIPSPMGGTKEVGLFNNILSNLRKPKPPKMNKPKIIFFSSGVQQKQLDHYLSQGGEMATFPFEYDLKKKDLKHRNSIVVLWFQPNEPKVIWKIKELQRSFPKVPIFLIGENPTNEDLLMAIKLKVHHFFTLPINKIAFHAAINQAIEGQQSKWSRTKGKIGHILHKMVKIDHFFIGQRWQPSAALNFLDQKYAALMPDNHLESTKFYDLKVQFFDDLKITKENEVLNTIRGKKNKSLLAYLLYKHNKPIHRELLMEKFWSEVGPSSARNSLNVAIYAIRKELATFFGEREVISFENDCYSINSELEILTDVEQFQFFWQKGKAIENSQNLKHALGAYNKALALYKGDFLARLRFEDWCEFERDQLKETYLFMLNRLSDFFFTQNEYDACINVCRKMLASDHCLEEVHRKLIKCFTKLGLNDLAVRQYLKCKEVLQHELNISPSEQTKTLFDQIQS